MTKLILLNGPPRSGKDFAGQLIVETVKPQIGAYCDKFARIVKERTHAAYGLVHGLYQDTLRHDVFEDVKDLPRVEFLGVTPRQAYIAFSERFYKPLHGNAVFGQLLLQDLTYRLPQLLVVTDSGFREEAEVLVRALGAASCRLIRLHRDGCDFSRDSRGFVELSDLGVEVHDVWNPGTLEGLREKLVNFVPEMRAAVSDRTST